MSANLFYKYYDTLYASKDYAGEVKTLMEIATKQKKVVKKILEIGCGTGNHTIELAKSKKQITAVDTDKFMAEIAKEKTKQFKNVKIHLGKIERLNEKNFDVAFAMFNVITYIPNLKSLQSFFKGVSSRLKKEGVFIFDCWNGIAAIKNPPGNKIFSETFDTKEITCELDSETDFMQQKVKLNYSISVSENSKILETDSFSFEQTLWTPAEIKYALQKSNLEVIKCCKNFYPGEAANETDWKIMFICKKIRN